MKKWIVVSLLLALPQFAAARVYMCVDHVTGATSFTDKACEDQSVSTREEVRVAPANLDSGANYAKKTGRKTWNSETDTRKSGIDYSVERRAANEDVRVADR
ncbi:MAG: hypothetical protein ACI9NT_002713 [Bacteroidia bacterium]|jgi:hypothetical protein